MKRRAASIALAVILLGPGAALADGDSGPWWRAEALTGDWGGRRDRLGARGIGLEAVYTAEVFSNRSGGVSRGSEYLDNIDLILTLDAERAFGWDGTSFLLYVLGNQGGDPSDRIGDAQTASNIAAPDTWKIYEAWSEMQIGARLTLLTGLYDLNSEFDVIEASRMFINSSHGIGADYAQSGRNGPSIFPTTSVALRARYHPTLGFYVQGAILDGVAGDPDDPGGTQIILGEEDGLLLAGEAAWLYGAAADVPPEARRHRVRRIGRLKDWGYEGKIALGLWSYTERSMDLLQGGGPAQRSRSRGAYLLAERQVFRHRDDPERGLDLFARFGIADSRVNRFGSYFGAGLVYTGPFPRRHADRIGLAVAAAINGGDFERAQSMAGMPVEDAEVVLELTYLAQILPWLAIQPDLQYVINPDTDPSRQDAFAAGLRVAISF